MKLVSNSPFNEIKAISFFSSSIQTKESVEEVLWDITKNVIHQLGFVDCVIYEYDSKSNILHQRAAYGYKNPADDFIHNKIILKLGEGIVGSVAISKTAEIVNDTSKDSRYVVDDAARLSEICVPIMINDNLFGIIDSEHPEKSFFNERHLHLLNIIAALCAQKIISLKNSTRKPLTRANEYFKRLEQLMKVDKIYQNPNLNLSSTADLLGISACYLSSLINSVIEGSFIDYVNGYRINDVKNNLHSPRFEHYNILSVGLEAGFNSKSTFYNAFKKHTGMSPSDYRDKDPFKVQFLSNLNI
ncbi:GAF domain-containing protein [Spongiivirga sp. MCCC 1A20706]|uniref:helix-turn-helix domain-containing protein n=1 Tax=Spongiivirga sp. MCCC 1A20706 TaxID=3160963 RepID=UPI0039775423